MGSPIQNPLLLMQLLQQNQNPLGVGAGQQAPIIPPADAMGLPPALPQSIPQFSPGSMQAGANLPQPSSMPQQGLENNPWYKLIQQLSPVILGAIGGPSMGYGAIQSQRIAQENQMRQQAQQAEIDQRNEQLKIQRENAATQAKALTNSQTRELADWAAKIGVGIDEMATILGITDPGPIAAAKSLEPMLKAERQKNIVYLDMETMKSYPTPDPTNPNLIEVTKKELFQMRRKDKEKAEDLYYVTLSDQGGKQYPTLIPAASVPEDLKKSLGKPLSIEAARAQVTAYSAVIKSNEAQQKIPAVEQQALSDYLKKNPGKGAADFLAWKSKLSPSAQYNDPSMQPSVLIEKPIGTDKNKIDPKTGLTPNAVWQHAIVNALEGKMPALGMRSSGQAQNARTAILNTAGSMADAAGADLATLQAEYKANSTALNKIVPLYRGTAAFVDTATHNIDLARNQSPKVPRTGSPIVNRYKQWAFGQTLTGNPELTKFETYIYTAAREYAKVTSGAALSVAGLTDTAQKEASKLLNAAQIPEAFNAATEAMINDMGNVVGAQERQIASISSVISSFLKVASGMSGIGAAQTGPAQHTDGGGPVTKQKFSRSKYLTAHPKADMKAVEAEAKKQGFEVID